MFEESKYFHKIQIAEDKPHSVRKTFHAYLCYLLLLIHKSVS